MGACFAKSSSVAPTSASSTAEASAPSPADPLRLPPAANGETSSRNAVVVRRLSSIIDPDTALSALIACDDGAAVSEAVSQRAPAESEARLRYLGELLLRAADCGAASTIDVLLSAGAQLSTTDDDGQCALHLAVVNGHLKAVDRLTAAQPCHELHLSDRFSMNPLHLAAEDGNVDMIMLLLARGARVVNTPNSPSPAAVRAPGHASSGFVAASAAEEQRLHAELDGAVEDPTTRIPRFGGSPIPKRKQLLAMQQSVIGGSAVFIARSHEHHDAVKLLERAAAGEPIALPDTLHDTLVSAESTT